MYRWVERNPIVCLGGLLGLWFIVFSTAFIMSSRVATPAIPPPTPFSEYDAQLLAMDRDGIEAAYREQVKLLFRNWMNDPSTHQPQRAITGLRNAAKAYVEAMDGAKQREAAIRQK